MQSEDSLFNLEEKTDYMNVVVVISLTSADLVSSNICVACNQSRPPCYCSIDS